MSTIRIASLTASVEKRIHFFLKMLECEGASVNCSEVILDASPARSIVQVTIEAGEAGKRVIGPHGEGLRALQHLVRTVVRREHPSVAVVVDMNGYRQARHERLARLAHVHARRAKQTGQAVALSPMNAADRRAVHTALTSYNDIHTESVGEEPHRRIVIRPVFL